MADPTTSKIRIRMGQIEVEYEGAHDYLSADLPKLLETVIALRSKAGADTRDDENDDPGDDENNQKASQGAITGTVAAQAAKLGATTGADLVIAAAAQLTLVQKKNSFKRNELLKAMKSATSYYKQTYSKNLSAILKGLLSSGRLTEPATSTYALTASELTTLESQLNA